MARRVELLGVRGADVRRSGSQIIVALPDVDHADEAQQQIATTAVLGFYDWEVSVLGPDGKPDPSNPGVTGGSSAGQPGAGTQTLYEAVTRASTFKATDEPGNTTAGVFYGVKGKAKSVVCGPQGSKADVRGACRDAGKKPTSIVKLPQGYLIVRSEADESSKAALAAASDAYYILEDDPALLEETSRIPTRASTMDPAAAVSPSSRSTSPTPAARSGKP